MVEIKTHNKNMLLKNCRSIQVIVLIIYTLYMNTWDNLTCIKKIWYFRMYIQRCNVFVENASYLWHHRKESGQGDGSSFHRPDVYRLVEFLAPSAARLSRNRNVRFYSRSSGEININAYQSLRVHHAVIARARSWRPIIRFRVSLGCTV